MHIREEAGQGILSRTIFISHIHLVWILNHSLA